MIVVVSLPEEYRSFFTEINPTIRFLSPEEANHYAYSLLDIRGRTSALAYGLAAQKSLESHLFTEIITILREDEGPPEGRYVLEYDLFGKTL